MLFRLLVPGSDASSTAHASSSTDRASTPLQQPRHGSKPTQSSNIQPSAVIGLSPYTPRVLCSGLSQEHTVPIQPASHADAGHQVATAASQSPNAAIEPLVIGNQQSQQQSVMASASHGTGSGSPSAHPDATEAPAQPLEHMDPASSQAGSQEGVVMLLCILSLMPRLPPLTCTPHIEPPQTSPRPYAPLQFSAVFELGEMCVKWHHHMTHSVFVAGYLI